MTAQIRVLDVVALRRDLPEHGLREPDVGTVVEIYAPSGVDVEFVTASGRTVAVSTLRLDDVRPLDGFDLPSVRPLGTQSS